MPTFPMDMYLPHTYIILRIGFFLKFHELCQNVRQTYSYSSEVLYINSPHIVCILKHLYAYTSNINAKKVKELI